MGGESSLRVATEGSVKNFQTLGRKSIITFLFLFLPMSWKSYLPFRRISFIDKNEGNGEGVELKGRRQLHTNAAKEKNQE